MTKDQKLLELAQQLLDAAHYCTELPRLESHCREIARKLEAIAERELPQSPREAREKEITRLATIEECAMVAEQYPSSGEQTEYPVEYWIRRLSNSRPDRTLGESK